MSENKKSPLAAITGGRGMIGRALQRALETQGIRYRTLGRSPVEDADSRHLVGATTDPEMVARLMDGATILFHLARTTHRIEDMCVYDYPAMMHLLPRAVDEGMEVHFTSSQMVHDGARQYPVTTIDEDFPFEPYDPYGAMKLAWERTLICYRKSAGLRYITYRCPCVIPPELVVGQHLAWYLQLGMEKGVIAPQNENERYGGASIIHAEDLAEVMVKNIGNTRAFGREYHICYDNYISYAELAQLCAEILHEQGVPVRTEWDVTGSPGPGFVVQQMCSNARAKEYLGFQDHSEGVLREKLRAALLRHQAAVRKNS